MAGWRRKGASAMLALLLLGTACGEELWLVELEADDGLWLHFKGAALERGSAPVWQGSQLLGHELRPGTRLALWQEAGVASRITVPDPAEPPPADWQRGQDRLRLRTGNTLQLARLGTVLLHEEVRWVNGSAADLHPGSELVLIRSAEGQLRQIDVINPEE
ncbi:hypothetical protein [Aeromonas simiae]|uniref:hypothetical protein n=2 Tax=Aeromonas simiae TaxID=218936 RepID=UPI001E4C2DFD|nr:hypothetical protein [Aeromonas simiae]